MKTSDKISSGQPARPSDADPPEPEQEDLPRPAGNRLFFWLLVASAFFILDMAILFYVLRPTPGDGTVEQARPAAAVQQGSESTSPLAEVKE